MGEVTGRCRRVRRSVKPGNGRGAAPIKALFDWAAVPVAELVRRGVAG